MTRRAGRSRPRPCAPAPGRGPPRGRQHRDGAGSAGRGCPCRGPPLDPSRHRTGASSSRASPPSAGRCHRAAGGSSLSPALSGLASGSGRAEVKTREPSGRKALLLSPTAERVRRRGAASPAGSTCHSAVRSFLPSGAGVATPTISREPSGERCSPDSRGRLTNWSKSKGSLMTGMVPDEARSGVRDRPATQGYARATLQSTPPRPTPDADRVPDATVRQPRPRRTTPMTQSPTATADRPHHAAKRYIYAWGDGRAEGDASMRDLLGGKGAGLAEMTKAGLPMPPGFTITTEACNDYFADGEQLPDGLWEDVLEAVREVEREHRQGLRRRRPTRCSSASAPGAKFSMPGMMDTVLNLGLNEETLQGLDRADRQRAVRLGRLPPLHPDVRPDRHGRERRALRPRARRGQGQARAPSRTPTSTPPRCASSSTEFKAIVKADTGRDFPTDPNEQLDLAIKAVFASWFGKRAGDYRKNQKIAARPGHGGQRRDDGLRQHGRRLRHRRRLHARPEHRRERCSTAST